MRKDIKTNKFYTVSFGIFLFLFLLRIIFPSLVPPVKSKELKGADTEEKVEQLCREVVEKESSHKSWHRVLGVHSFDESFPDQQDVQLASARKWGVNPPANREEAEKRKDELVYVGNSFYHHIDASMTNSMPYLVPRASILLEDIGRNFYDSLYSKHIPLHKIIVTSVLRSDEDVARLQQQNGNATTQSCHRFGTTFDVAYERYYPIEAEGYRKSEPYDFARIKQVLCEVMRDLREQGRCYAKYERRQSCFHITVR